jgi:hypothetical protein
MKLRYERKYLVQNSKLDELRNRLMPFLRPDIFAEQTNLIPQYTVRSIYFDTPNYNALYEKKEGMENRKKLRIRGYNTYQKGCEVFLEIKRKIGNRISKNRALTQFDNLSQTLESGEISLLSERISDRMLTDASKFFFNLKKGGQKPVNIVVYEREPYHGKFNPEVRITFDKNIRAGLFPELSELFSHDNLSLIWKDSFIMEVKYFEGGMPSWAKSIINEFGLRHEALSKYAAAFYSKEISMYNTKM